MELFAWSLPLLLASWKLKLWILSFEAMRPRHEIQGEVLVGVHDVWSMSAHQQAAPNCALAHFLLRHPGLAVGRYKIPGTRGVSFLFIDFFDLHSLVLVLSHSFRWPAHSFLLYDCVAHFLFFCIFITKPGHYKILHHTTFRTGSTTAENVYLIDFDPARNSWSSWS
jgi:hypothetical protein